MGGHGEPQLEVLKKYGTKAVITDLAILTGLINRFSYIYNGSTVRIGYFWTSSDDKYSYIRSVTSGGEKGHIDRCFRYYAIRPVLQSSSLFFQIYPNRVKGDYGTEEVEYGEYPQMAADANMQKILEDIYIKRTIKKTGKTYTFDCRKYDEYIKGFRPIIHEEYEYQGKKIY